jgi:hypothetical protein
MSTSRFTGSTLNAWRVRHGLQVDEMAWVFGYSISTLKDKLYSRSPIRLDTDRIARVGRSRAASTIRAAWLADTAASPHPPERRSWITLRPQRCGPPRPRECRRLGQRAKANASCRLDRSRTNTMVRSAIESDGVAAGCTTCAPKREGKKSSLYADANRSCAEAHTPFYRRVHRFFSTGSSIDRLDARRRAGGVAVLRANGRLVRGVTRVHRCNRPCAHQNGEICAVHRNVPL